MLLICHNQPVHVSIHGAHLYYDLSGPDHGPSLLLMHGFGGCRHDWLPLMELLKNNGLEGHRFILPDLRGHGQSTNPSGEYTHRQAALDTFALLDQLGVQQFKAIGVSGGGQALLHMATEQPERVVKLILVSAGQYYPEQARKIMQAYSAAAHTEEEWKLMRTRHALGDDQIRAIFAQPAKFAGDRDDMSFTPDRLTAITADTLIVFGDRDPFYPVSMALEQYSAIRKSRLWVVPNGGHGPISGAMREQFATTAAEFLRG